jgi:putative MATE family efflux protein
MNRTASVVADRTRWLLEAPTAPTLLRLATPNIAINLLLIAVNPTVDAYFAGQLGQEALAGLSLAFPWVMLMQQVANAGMGGAVTSAVARAIGADRREDARALVVHALIIATAMAAIFAACLLLGGPAIYRAMGGTGATQHAALAYSNIVFGGALAYWVFSALTGVVRGTGHIIFLAAVYLGVELLHVALTPALMFGWGPFPTLGLGGASAATVTSFSLRSLALLASLRSRRSLVRASLRGVRLRWALFWEILRVGVPGSASPVLNNLSLIVLTGFVSSFGAAALAGYGMAVRIEYVQMPLVFGVGLGLITMVGTNIGANQAARAARVGWVGIALAMAVTGSVGLLAAVFPGAWMGLFSGDPALVAAGALYLRIVGPTYLFLGAGIALYSTFQAAGRPLWPLIAVVSRLVVAIGGGWIALRWFEAGLPALFMIIGLGLVVSTTIAGIAFKAGAWR